MFLELVYICFKIIQSSIVFTYPVFCLIAEIGKILSGCGVKFALVEISFLYGVRLVEGQLSLTVR